MAETAERSWGFHVRLESKDELKDILCYQSGETELHFSHEERARVVRLLERCRGEGLRTRRGSVAALLQPDLGSRVARAQQMLDAQRDAGFRKRKLSFVGRTGDKSSRASASTETENRAISPRGKVQLPNIPVATENKSNSSNLSQRKPLPPTRLSSSAEAVHVVDKLRTTKPQPKEDTKPEVLNMRAATKTAPYEGNKAAIITHDIVATTAPVTPICAEQKPAEQTIQPGTPIQISQASVHITQPEMREMSATEEVEQKKLSAPPDVHPIDLSVIASTCVEETRDSTSFKSETTPSVTNSSQSPPKSGALTEQDVPSILLLSNLLQQHKGLPRRSSKPEDEGWVYPDSEFLATDPSSAADKSHGLRGWVGAISPAGQGRRSTGATWEASVTRRKFTQQIASTTGDDSAEKSQKKPAPLLKTTSWNRVTVTSTVSGHRRSRRKSSRPASVDLTRSLSRATPPVFLEPLGSARINNTDTQNAAFPSMDTNMEAHESKTAQTSPPKTSSSSHITTTSTATPLNLSGRYGHSKSYTFGTTPSKRRSSEGDLSPTRRTKGDDNEDDEDEVMMVMKGEKKEVEQAECKKGSGSQLVHSGLSEADKQRLNEAFVQSPATARAVITLQNRVRTRKAQKAYCKRGMLF